MSLIRRAQGRLVGGRLRRQVRCLPPPNPGSPTAVCALQLFAPCNITRSPLGGSPATVNRVPRPGGPGRDGRGAGRVALRPAYPQHSLAEPELENVRAALRLVLAAHEPYPAVAADRCWEMEDANSGVAVLAEGCSADLLTHRGGTGYRAVLSGHRGRGRAAFEPARLDLSGVVPLHGAEPAASATPFCSRPCGMIFSDIGKVLRLPHRAQWCSPREA
jgi:hypothetical protein